MIEIIDFTKEHIEAAKKIALENYEEERKKVISLPEVKEIPDLMHFADNQLGVSAFEGEKMLGYLCAYFPMDNAFGTTFVKGTFSPMHAHGVIQTSNTSQLDRMDTVCKYSKEQIYSKMYQKAADKWVKAGILIHTIALYAHDEEAIHSFFFNGFGLRCIDAIRPMEGITEKSEHPDSITEDLIYQEVPRDEWKYMVDMNNQLISHLSHSPIFMNYELLDEKEFYRKKSQDSLYFAVKRYDKYIAYIYITKEGETFITKDSSMVNINGAYCDIEYRGSGIYHNLLAYTIQTLKKEGYTRLGVDFESFNPTARGFWLKNFEAYTSSVVRRIDDKAFINKD